MPYLGSVGWLTDKKDEGSRHFGEPSCDAATAVGSLWDMIGGLML